MTYVTQKVGLRCCTCLCSLLFIFGAYGFVFIFSIFSHLFYITPDYNVPAQIGDKLELTCSTTGCESPSFSWRTQMDNPLGGSVMNMGSSSILTMDPVGIENEHEYLCSACCGSRKEERSIRVDVYSFPSDPVIEISTPLNVGEKANITCMVPKVYPSERLKMQLEKDGSVLGMKEFYEEGSTITTETKSLTLTFIPTFEDIGKAITCVAELPIDEMEFEPKKRQTSQRLSELIVGSGPSLVLTIDCRQKCDSIGSLPPLCRISVSRADNLAPNKEPSLCSLLITKNGSFVLDGPRNTTVSVTPSTTVKEGGAVTMTCTSYGNPSPKISWTKHSISGESQFLSENATLTINNVKAEDLGLYECEGVNQFGREKKTVDLIVQGPAESLHPEAVSPAERLTAMGCVDIPIVCESGRYTIYGARLEDAGMYEYESSNQLGQQFKNIMLDVKEMVKETDFVIPVIVVLSCLSTVATPALAILVYRSRKAKINGSYSPVNAPKPNV
uniref:Vascular cell adhesion molecule 1 n=1 Tax=Chrysemys picta bellii TaxID=8478 RepID=A0A8C3IV92_CHRPI